MNNFSDRKSSFSFIYNSKFSITDIESVLQPLFAYYYGFERLRQFILNSEHIWSVFDRRKKCFVASALLSDYDDRRTLYLNLFGVEESSQGQGIGTRLLMKIRRWARKNNYRAIILHTQIDNNRAINLYEKLGFTKEFYFKDFFLRPSNFSSTQLHESDAYQMILLL